MQSLGFLLLNRRRAGSGAQHPPRSVDDAHSLGLSKAHVAVAVVLALAAQPAVEHALGLLHEGAHGAHRLAVRVLVLAPERAQLLELRGGRVVLLAQLLQPRLLALVTDRLPDGCWRGRVRESSQVACRRATRPAAR